MARASAIDKAIAQLEAEIAPLKAQIDQREHAIRALKSHQQRQPKRTRKSKPPVVAPDPRD